MGCSETWSGWSAGYAHFITLRPYLWWNLILSAYPVIRRYADFPKTQNFWVKCREVYHLSSIPLYALVKRDCLALWRPHLKIILLFFFISLHINSHFKDSYPNRDSMYCNVVCSTIFAMLHLQLWFFGQSGTFAYRIRKYNWFYPRNDERCHLSQGFSRIQPKCNVRNSLFYRKVAIVCRRIATQAAPVAICRTIYINTLGNV